MQIEVRAIDQVRPYDHNPRDNDKAVDAVAASLQQFGWRQPIVVNEKGVIVVGHTRWKGAKKLCMTEVPVHVAMGLTPTQVRAYRIADNATASLAEWDEDLLPLELGALKDLDFDLNLLGFESEALLEWMSGGVGDGLADPDDVPAPPDEPVTQPGDLWLLGDLPSQ